MKKLRLLVIGIVFMMALSMASCKDKAECVKNGHTWIEATCKEAKHCQICGQVEGVTLAHSWIEATCKEAKHCQTCGQVEGVTLAHSWIEATCKEAKHCQTCGQVEGVTLAHSWIEATCKEAKHCQTCGQVEGATLAHSWVEATCEEAKHCQICGQVEGTTLAHNWIEATCLSSEKCSECGYVRNQQLGEHKMVEATYLHTAYCEVCQKQFGERLVCDPVSLEAKWSIEGRFLTSEQYQNFGKYVKVYGILENGEKVELSNEDIEFKESLLSDSKCMSLFYRGVECLTDKVLLKLLETIPFDFNQLQVMEEQTIIGSDCFSMVGIYVDSLQEYLNKKGYIVISDYFTSCGFNYPNITKMYSVTGSFVPMQYYNKDNYCIFVEKDSIYDTSERAYQRIYVYKMPEKFVTMGLDLLLSDNIYNLYYKVEKSSGYTIGDSQNPILSVKGDRTTIALQYFSKAEKDKLFDNISQFYGHSYETYQEGTITYYHFTGNEQNDIIIKITPTSGEYVDIEFSLIEKA